MVFLDLNMLSFLNEEGGCVGRNYNDLSTQTHRDVLCKKNKEIDCVVKMHSFVCVLGGGGGGGGVLTTPL